jgi:predicted ATP-binding protein involved in virulence
MHLQRIQVPDFRVLKDVDITFEKEFVPRIFPLGSLNGGRKSTLLQLIFVLLHCSTNPDKIIFLKNILKYFKILKESDRRVLAIFDIWDGEKTVQLEFFSTKIHMSNIY